MTIQYVTAFVACAIGVLTDLRGGRVPNWVTLPLIVFALAFVLPKGAGALGIEVVLIVALTIAGIALHETGTLGGGDIKLLIGVGALLGYPGCIALALYTGIAGGLLAALFLAVRVAARPSKRKTRLPYAVAIAAGVVLTVLSYTSVPALRIHL